MSEAVTEILFIWILLCDSFNVNFDKPIKMYEDNSGAIAIAKFGIKLDSHLNLADMLTKNLDKKNFWKIEKSWDWFQGYK